MAVQPLSPATDRRLGGPLPHQLPNQTQAHLRAASLWYKPHARSICHEVLATVSGCYPAPGGRLLTRYSPVRHWCIATPVRLECVMHAASVNPEPGSNSLKNVYLNSQGEPKSFFRANFNLSFLLLLSFFTQVFWQEFAQLCFFLCVVQFSMIKCSRTESLSIILHSSQFVNTFFEIFLDFFEFYPFVRFQLILSRVFVHPAQRFCRAWYFLKMLRLFYWQYLCIVL